jgi:hypothetical protein
MTQTHEVSRHSGDINLVAALMSLGIPLDASKPVTVMDNVRGIYGSFHFGEYSDNGEEDAETLLSYWNGHQPTPAGHGFAAICHFIRSRPRGVHTTPDLLDFAVDYLGARDHRLPGLRTLDDIPAFVAALPQGDAAHILAYVWNREVCLRLYRAAGKTLYYESGDGHQTRRALVDSRLPRWQAKEILSRLEG